VYDFGTKNREREKPKPRRKKMNDLALLEKIGDMVSSMPDKYVPMLKEIQAGLPEIRRASQAFFKTQSQFMDNMLTVSHPTPLRNLRQILAEMNRTMEAIRENYFNRLRLELKIKKSKHKLENDPFLDEFDREEIGIDLADDQSKKEVQEAYWGGAIRKLRNYMEQYQSILNTLGVKNWTEIDFEGEEERYHIMKAFEQGLNAARAHHGIVDEGNMIYFYQIGINGGVAQAYVLRFLLEEERLIKEGGNVSHSAVIHFLEEMANTFKGCSKKFAEMKGMTGNIVEEATLADVYANMGKESE